MDRLFDRADHPEDVQLAELANLELRLEQRQLARRALVAATALAGLPCWLAAQLPRVAWLQVAPALFVAAALAAAAAFTAERRVAARRRALVAQLPAQTRRLVCAA